MVPQPRPGLLGFAFGVALSLGGQSKLTRTKLNTSKAMAIHHANSRSEMYQYTKSHPQHHSGSRHLSWPSTLPSQRSEQPWLRQDRRHAFSGLLMSWRSWHTASQCPSSWVDEGFPSTGSCRISRCSLVVSSEQVVISMDSPWHCAGHTDCGESLAAFPVHEHFSTPYDSMTLRSPSPFCQ